ncbi:MAG: F0F1 ATP synthase subunit epsilon [Bifidobacteriaceae bacterium]|jgi:F-type H+-transporting ATPase subunit epsilon|nr:F0F1 ATP synthase subunit epsilon [Bifidobacteriaceae bacterium]
MAALELRVEIADWQGEVWSGQASFFTAPSVEGPIGIYPRHEPLLAILRAGEVKVAPSPPGPDVKVRVTGGFLSVDSDIVTVIADEAELAASVK